ncbi:MAG TPA: hypothetical protein VNO81_10885, partial [Candidatus Nitrosotenuis sp.]|nr:hypothetical protein [Candidatus Nitrosotenuis sp.]
APLLAFLVLLAAPARAELVHRGTRVYTTGDFKEVVIEVTVKNYGNDPVEDVAVVIELEPTPRASAYRTVVELGTLEPGQEKTATYRPGLRATSNFDGTRDSFDVTFGTLSGATLNVRYKVAVAVRAGR